MSEAQVLIVDAAERLFTDLCTRAVSARAERGEWPTALWRGVEEAGLSLAAHSEARAGPGAALADVAALVRVAGRFAAPIPLAETLLAEQMLAAADLPPRPGPLGVGPVISSDRLRLGRSGTAWLLSGTLHRIPWGRDVAAIVAVAEHQGEPLTVVIERPDSVRRDHNYAHEPRDDIRLDDCVLAQGRVGEPGRGWDAATLRFRGALYRCLQMSGALERVLEMTVGYAKERIAFGRPIGKFQAVQQQIAVLATQVAAASAATQAAVDALQRSDGHFAIGAAKARVGEAAGIAAAIAHQVHAAMGFTHEHTLHLSTRRLWSWRDEFGNEADWFAWVGQEAARVGGESLWAFLTAAAGGSTR